jgi:cysteine-rich repeat protein
MTLRSRTLTTFTVLVFSIPILYGGCNPCGNGKLDKGEQCDDGNNTPMDGCDGQCKLETASSCASRTGSQFLTAAGADAEAKQMLSLASVLKWDSTGSGIYDARECNEGGPTTWWFARFKVQKTNHNPDAIMWWRKDSPVGERVAFTHTDGGSNVWIEFRDYVIHKDHSGTPAIITITARDGTLIRSGTDTAVSTTTTLPGAAAAPADMTLPERATGGQVGYPSPAFLDFFVSDAEAQTTGPDDCWLDYMTFLQKLAEYWDNHWGHINDASDHVEDCISHPASCDPTKPMQDIVFFARDDDPPKAWAGGPCTDKNCMRGTCIDNDPSPQITDPLCSVPAGAVSDCNIGCNETCDTTTGKCYGAKITSVVPTPDLVVSAMIQNTNDNSLWCPSASDPVFDNYLSPHDEYTPQLTIGWCGRIKMGDFPYISISWDPCPPGWICTDGSQGYPEAMPNPAVFKDGGECCSLDVPQGLTFAAQITTAGRTSPKFDFAATCEPQAFDQGICTNDPPGGPIVNAYNCPGF